MRFFEALLSAMSLYSAIPMPRRTWDLSNMQYTICFLPVVGILCGGLLFGWYSLCRAAGIHAFLFAVVAAAIPILITGGIHMDGFMDTVDALASHQPPQRKLEILKDSRNGAFAVMYGTLYLLMQTALFYELYLLKGIAVVCPIFALSRTLSVLCAVNIPNARKNGMLFFSTKDAKRKWVNISMLIFAAVLSGVMISLSSSAGGAAFCVSVLLVPIYRRMAIKQFGGVTGDTAGFFLQMCELVCLIGGCIGGWLK